ncbi:hypothetical protein EVAR_21497_1 [Eumeta japonica]|uniref:Uncharacterized protein n=1 Tax=Eumeta variegata TaxID=151549 RepID=A0A4C1UYX6_EUMVA|nr:hypothetical protein EVAR_21497_1 [Eumeta japonica]
MDSNRYDARPRRIRIMMRRPSHAPNGMRDRFSIIAGEARAEGRVARLANDFAAAFAPMPRYFGRAPSAPLPPGIDLHLRALLCNVVPSRGTVRRRTDLLI